MALLGTYLEYIGCNGKKVPNGHWKNKDNHKIYCEYLFKKLGYTTMEDWYKTIRKDIRKNGGGGLLECCYNGSVTQLLKAVYPDYKWFIFKFKSCPNGHWNLYEHQKEYIEWLGEELGYTTMEDWYKITVNIIHSNYGGALINNQYKNLHQVELLKSMYPYYDWLEWKFCLVPQGWWKDIEHKKKFMRVLKQTLGYTTMEDWYKINNKIIINNGGDWLTRYYSSIELLSLVYPNYNWDKSKFNYNKTERIIKDFLLKNKSNFQFTNDKIDEYCPTWFEERYRYDFYIKLINGKEIIIECDGEQHYTEHFHHRDDWTLEKQEDRDIYKMQKALDNNCSIIRVHQEEVYNDTIDWKKELTDAINEIKNENDTSIKLLGCLKDKICWILE